MIVTVFRARINEGVEQQLDEVGARMYELATQMPGFISYKDFHADDGEVVSLIEFESLEDVAAWHAHPEHQAAQALGYSTFFSTMKIQVCEVVREHTKSV